MITTRKMKEHLRGLYGLDVPLSLLLPIIGILAAHLEKPTLKVFVELHYNQLYANAFGDLVCRATHGKWQLVDSDGKQLDLDMYINDLAERNKLVLINA